MPLALACPQCQKKLNVPDNAAGRKVKCPGCSHIFLAQASAAASPPAPARPSQVKAAPAKPPQAAAGPRPSEMKPPTAPKRPSEVKPPVESRLSELKLEEMPGRTAGNDLNAVAPPPATSAPAGGKQMPLRVIVFLLCAVGAAAASFLGFIGLETLKKELQSVQPQLEMIKALDPKLAAEALAPIFKATIIYYLLFAASVIGLICGIRAFKSKGLLPGLVLLIVIGAPAFLLADRIRENPAGLIFMAPLALAGLLCLPLRERSVPVGKKHLLMDIPLALSAVAVIGVAVFAQFFLGQLGSGTKGGLPLDLLLDKERTSIQERGKEELRGSGFASPEDDIQQFSKALIDLDVAAYRAWLDSDPQAGKDFQRMADFEAEAGKKEPTLAAKQILNDMVRGDYIKSHARRTPVLPDGNEYASIVILTRPSFGDTRYRKFAYKQKDGRWFRIGEATGALSELKPPLEVPAAQLLDLFPPDAPLTVLNVTPVLRGDDKLPASAAEAQAMLKTKYPEATFNGDGQLVSFNKDFVFVSDIPQVKAIFKVLSPAFKDKKLSMIAYFVDDADLAKLDGLENLEELQLMGEHAICTEKGLASIKKLTNLKKLEINALYATDAWLVHLKDMNKLTEVKLQSRITDAGLAHLSGLSELTELELKNNYIKGPGLAQLKGLDKLRVLNLEGNSLTGAGLDSLAALPKLERLSVTHNSLDDEAMKSLAGLKELESLDLEGNLITDAGLARLSGLDKLTFLDLSSNRLQGTALGQIKSLGKGNVFKGTLSIKKNPLNDEGVGHLGELMRAGQVTLDMDDETLARVRLLLNRDPHLGDVEVLAFSPDGSTLASGGNRSDIKLWDVAARRVRDSMHVSGNNQIHGLAFSADGRQLASAADNIYVWNVLAAKKEKDKVIGGTGRCVAFLPRAGTLVIGSESYGDDHQGLELWEQGAEDTRKLISVPYQARALALSSDGKALATITAKGDDAKKIKLWQIGAGKAEAPRVLEGHVDPVLSLAWAGPNTLVTGGKDRTIKVWDTLSGKVTATLQGHDEEVSSVSVSNDGKVLASGSKDKTVRLWDLSSGKELATITDLPIPINAVALSADGKSLAAGGELYAEFRAPKAKETLKIWTVADAIKSFPPGSKPADPLAALKRLKAGIKMDGDMPLGVSLYGDNVYDDDLAALASLKSLESVSVSSPHITDAGLKHLAGLEGLQKLTLQRGKFTDAGLKQLAGLTELEYLDLDRSSIDGSGLAALKAPGLKHLDLMNSKVTDAGLAASLKNFPNLEMLNLYECSIAGKGLASLPANVKFLNLNGCKAFDDAGLAELKKLVNLESLSLKNTQVSDDGLMQLKDLAKLRSLEIENSKATPDGLRKLRATQAAGNPALYIQNLGGNVEIDDDKPDKPVVGIRLTDKFAAADLAHLKKFPQLRGLVLDDVKLTDADLAQLKDLTGLESLELVSMPIDGAGLAHFKGNTGLRRLRLFYIKLSDAGLKNAASFPKLESLQVNGSAEDLKVTDAGLASLAGLTELTHLNLDSLPIKGSGLANLKGLTKLKVLSIQNCKLDNAALASLKSLTALEQLDLSNAGVNDAGLANVVGLTALRQLRLFNDPVTGAGLAHLAGLVNLDSLTLSDTRADDAGLAHLKKLTRLTYLDLEGTAVSDAGLEHLKGLVKLTSIDTTKTKVTPEGLKAFKDAIAAANPATAIRNLGGFVDEDDPNDIMIDLSGEKVTDAALALLKKYPKVAKLDLAGSKVTDAGLAQLKAYTGLKRLILNGVPVGDAGLANLATLTNLEELGLDGAKVSAAGLGHLKGLASLKNLDLENTPTDDAGLAVIRNFTKLENLNLGSTAVSDAGLLQLKGLTGLKKLAVFESKVTEKGVKQLQEALPKLMIDQ